MEAEPAGGRGPRWPRAAIAVAIALVVGTIAVGAIGGGKPETVVTQSFPSRTALTAPPPATPSPGVKTTVNTAPPPTGDPLRRRTKARACARPGAPAGRGGAGSSRQRARSCRTRGAGR